MCSTSDPHRQHSPLKVSFRLHARHFGPSFLVLGRTHPRVAVRNVHVRPRGMRRDLLRAPSLKPAWRPRTTTAAVFSATSEGASCSDDAVPVAPPTRGTGGGCKFLFTPLAMNRTGDLSRSGDRRGAPISIGTLVERERGSTALNIALHRQHTGSRSASAHTQRARTASPAATSVCGSAPRTLAAGSPGSPGWHAAFSVVRGQAGTQRAVHQRHGAAAGGTGGTYVYVEEAPSDQQPD